MGLRLFSQCSGYRCVCISARVFCPYKLFFLLVPILSESGHPIEQYQYDFHQSTRPDSDRDWEPVSVAFSGLDCIYCHNLSAEAMMRLRSLRDEEWGGALTKIRIRQIPLARMADHNFFNRNLA